MLPRDTQRFECSVSKSPASKGLSGDIKITSVRRGKSPLLTGGIKCHCVHEEVAKRIENVGFTMKYVSYADAKTTSNFAGRD